MKRTAIFILIVFSLVQVTPALQSFFSESSALVFNVDEEKNSDKTETLDKKEKTDYTDFISLLKNQSLKIRLAFHLSESIAPFPCLEKPTPPPNFC